MHSQSFYLAAAASLFASANGHFFISQPPPVPGSAPKDPLDPSGSNFPCHGADLSAGTSTPMAAGSQQPLKFELGGGANTAVHGGGSCQISLTYETDATKQKDPNNWKVIHSFVGGCPTNAAGNLVKAVACPDSSPGCVNQDFTFQIPSEVQNGNAILAWTWFNNIGNREMYMNCAKVSISGGSGKMSSLPAMAVANLASVNQCKTTEQFNTQFPNPGSYVTTASTLNYPTKLMQSCGSGSGSGSGSTGGSSGSTGSPAAAPVVAPSPSAAVSGSGTSNANTGTNPGGVFAPGAASSAPNAVASAVAPTVPKLPTTFLTAPVPAATAASPNPASSVSSGASTGQCGNGQIACSASGFYCVNASTFGMCAWGCATPMKVSAGTSCSNGAIVATSQRLVKRRPGHLHARAHSNLANAA